MTGVPDSREASSGKSCPELLVIIPVYNEQASIRKVINEWFEEIENWTEDFEFLVLDDGSTDETRNIVETLKEKHGERIKTVSGENKGHGQTCLEGYRMAVQSGVPWILQIDSDGQCDPQFFFRFWRVRDNFDVVYGKRTRRDDGWRRVFASIVLRATLLIFGRANCVDANVPYRLMRSSALKKALGEVQETFFLANVGLALALRRNSSVRHGYIPIRFRERYGGEPSVRFGRFGAKARELVRDIKVQRSRRG